MAPARLLLAFLLTCADCLQTEGEWHAAPSPNPKDSIKREDSVCYMKPGHFYGFHTDDLTEDSYKKLKNNMDLLFAPMDYLWGILTNRRYLVGLKVMHWGEEGKPKICDVTEIFKWTLVQRGASDSQLKSQGEPLTNEAAAKVLQGVGLQYSKENAWEMYSALRGVWATEIGVLVARAVKVGFREFPPDVYPEVLGIEIKLMNEGCKGTLFCTAKIVKRRLLIAKVEQDFFMGMKDPGAETKGAGAEEKKEEAKTEAEKPKEEPKKEEPKKEEPKKEEPKEEKGFLSSIFGTSEKKDEKTEEPKKEEESKGFFGGMFGTSETKDEKADETKAEEKKEEEKKEEEKKEEEKKEEKPEEEEDEESKNTIGYGRRDDDEKKEESWFGGKSWFGS